MRPPGGSGGRRWRGAALELGGAGNVLPEPPADVRCRASTPVRAGRVDEDRVEGLGERVVRLRRRTRRPAPAASLIRLRARPGWAGPRRHARPAQSSARWVVSGLARRRGRGPAPGLRIEIGRPSSTSWPALGSGPREQDRRRIALDGERRRAAADWAGPRAEAPRCRIRIARFGPKLPPPPMSQSWEVRTLSASGSRGRPPSGAPR
jgi:hypothetical protein